MRSLPFVFVLALSGCYLSHASEDAGIPEDAPSCAPRPELVCVRAADTCSAYETVAPECDPASLELRCPDGARERAVVTASDTCLPFTELDAIRRIAGAPVRVPTEDGCLWILPEVELASGEIVENSGVIVDPELPFGACPSTGEIVGGTPTSLVEGSEGPDIVSLAGSYRIAGGPLQIAFRGFEYDAEGGFGVRNDGTGIAQWDEVRRRILVPSTLRWPPEIDLGDAVFADGAYAYLYGCPGPPDSLTEACFVGRVDASGVEERWVGDRWSADGEPAMVFDAGPWRSSVVRLRDGRYLHVYAAGFGSGLEAHIASAPQGPWSSLGVLAACDLPDDEGAYCAGPTVHEELADPLAPSTITVSYSVGSTTPGWGDRARANPPEYWPRLVRVPVP